MLNNTTIQQPRLRVNRTASLQLNTTWQDIDFNGTSNQNINTFGVANVETGLKTVYYDPVTKLFRFTGDYDWNFNIQLYPATSTNLITLRSVLQMRCVVPNGVSPGVDYYFPYPEGGSTTAYMDIGEVTLLANGINHPAVNISTYASTLIRTNGFKIQLRLSNSLISLGVCNLVSCNLLIN